MRANEIVAPLTRFISSESPYRCILINGAWGIGKSYEVNSVCKEHKNCTYISLFGLNDLQDLYREIFIARMPRKKADLDPLFSNILKIGEGLLRGKASFLSSVFTPQSLVRLLPEAKDGHAQIVIIDDLERLSSEISFDKLLGALEGLLLTERYRIILVANTDELKPEHSEPFKQYQEKVIDRTYTITEPSDRFMESDDPLERLFAVEHSVKNIRTMIKAEQFYQDIRLQLAEFDFSIDYLGVIRHACYSIVFEVTDRIYAKEAVEKEQDDFYAAFMADLPARIDVKYFNQGLAADYRSSLVRLLLEYYQCDCALNVELVVALYAMAIKQKEKPNIYKSDSEILELVQSIRNDFLRGSSDITLGDANNAVCWMEVMGMDTAEFEDLAKERLLNKARISINLDNRFYDSICAIRYENSKVKAIAQLMGTEQKRAYLNKLLESISQLMLSHDYIQALKRIDFFEDHCHEEDAKTIFRKHQDILFSNDVFPQGSISEAQHPCFSRLVRICRKIDANFFERRCSEVLAAFPDDHMLAYRIGA